MRRAAIVAALATVGAIVVVLAVTGGWWSGGPATPPATPISVRASATPGAVHFGDALTADAVVALDPRRLDPDSVRLAPQFLSYRVANARRKVRHAGGTTTIDWAFDLDCLGAGCAPGRPQVVLQFPAAVLHYRTVDGRPGRLPVVWPTITVASRLDDEDRAAPTSHLRVAAVPPAVSYDVAPGPLADGLAAGSALLVLAAGALLVLAFRRRTAPAAVRAAPRHGSPLDDALRLVRETAANGHDPGLRRLALQRLVRELRVVGRPGLADDAGRLAWSDGPPSADGTNEIADRVEREISSP